MNDDFDPDIIDFDGPTGDIPVEREHVRVRVIYRSPKHWCTGPDCEYVAEAKAHA